MNKIKDPRKCLFQVLGTGAVCLITLTANADNVEKYLPFTAATWLIVGPLIACLWALEVLCEREGGD